MCTRADRHRVAVCHPPTPHIPGSHALGDYLSPSETPTFCETFQSTCPVQGPSFISSHFDVLSLPFEPLAEISITKTLIKPRLKDAPTQETAPRAIFHGETYRLCLEIGGLYPRPWGDRQLECSGATTLCAPESRLLSEPY